MTTSARARARPGAEDREVLRDPRRRHDYAAWLFIVAVGLTLIYGVMKVLNVAHGGFYSMGAYAAA